MEGDIMNTDDPIRDEIDTMILRKIAETEFQTFNKIPRLSRRCVVTEKIDGTNAQLLITEDGKLFAGSRSRWLVENDVLKCDNFGFGAWALQHKDELVTGLGIGRHFGEWWGAGIQRKYGLKEKRFSLFNTDRWKEDNKPACCHVVPVLYDGMFTTNEINVTLAHLAFNGSVAAPGFMKPEGIVIYHVAANSFFKKTIEGDESPKGLVDNNG